MSSLVMSSFHYIPFTYSLISAVFSYAPSSTSSQFAMYGPFSTKHTKYGDLSFDLWRGLVVTWLDHITSFNGVSIYTLCKLWLLWHSTSLASVTNVHAFLPCFIVILVPYVMSGYTKKKTKRKKKRHCGKSKSQCTLSFFYVTTETITLRKRNQLQNN